VYLGYYLLGRQILTGRGELFPGFPALILAEIGRPQPAGQVVDFWDPARADPALWQATLDLFQEGGDFTGRLEPPSTEMGEQHRGMIAEARSLIRCLDPPLAGLMDRLQPLLVLCAPGANARFSGQGFGNATCFFFRGASLFNASRATNPIQMAERLVHEYAHAELFVLAQDGALCLNGDDERHSVRIRPDPRPMNGILHALHVVSRVCPVLERALSRGIPTSGEREALKASCRVLIAQQKEYGASSLAVIRSHAQLTPLGEAVVEAAAARLGGGVVA
jgi:HEXXH motif-containing protein